MKTFRRSTAEARARAKLLRQGEPRLRRFADLVRERMAPAQVWVFGSRARGDERLESDWDLLVVFDDADANAAADDRTLWRISREAGLAADVVAVTAGDAVASRNVANTLMHAISREGVAVEIALWDLAGQRHGIPVHEALGGAARTTIPAYNTCAGYAYNTSGVQRRDIGADDAALGPYDAQVAFMRDAGTLAESLVSEGYAAMKIWPFDIYASASGGHLISLTALKAGLEPFREVRVAVGDRIEIMCELYSLWGTHAAARICRGLEDYGVFWAEDPIGKMDDTVALADLRRQTRTPICGSETLGGLMPFRTLLAVDALDVVMLDLAWCGGLTVGRKIAAIAESHAKPLAPHDCTEPVTLMAGLHLAIHAPTAIYQEVVRATLATWYRELVTGLPAVQGGTIAAPEGPGLGMTLHAAIRSRQDATVRMSGVARVA